MSRIIRNIINNLLPDKNKELEYIFIHSNSNKDIALINSLRGQVYSLEKHDLDLDNQISFIKDSDLSNNLIIRPDFILNTHIGKYQQAKHMSNIFHCKLVNYFYSIDNVKKEGILALILELEKDINFASSQDIGDHLFLTNCQICQISDFRKILTGIL